MGRYLVLSAIGKDRPGIVEEVSKYLYERGCSIADSRMAILGGDFAIIMLISGEEQQIQAVQRDAADLESTCGLTVLMRPTSDPAERGIEPFVPYKLSVVMMDHAGIVHKVTHLLRSFGINISSLETTRTNAPITGTPIFSVSAQIELPTKVSVPKLRAAIAELCEQLNADAELAPRVK